MAEEVASAIILDSGSGYCKAGLTADDVPKAVFPAIVGRMKIDMGNGDKEKVVGREALEKKGLLNITKPTVRGFVRDWDALELVWQHCFQNELKVESADHPLLFGVYPDETKSFKERMALLFFEQFGVPGLYCAVHGLLALYGSGKTTGLVIDSGEDVTNIVPIQDGYMVTTAHGMIELGGSDINEYLQTLLKNKKIILDIEDARKVKEARVYCANEFGKEHDSYKAGMVKHSVYELPDRTIIELGEEQIQAAEILFRPAILGKFDPGVHEMISECLQKVDIELKRELFGNIILCGGTSLIQNYSNRLNRELVTISPNNIKVKIVAGSDRQFLAWNGGSLISSLATFQSMWITHAEYEENGPSIIHRKCL